MAATTLFTGEVVLDGVVQGLVYGLVAAALVLVHRSTKVVNFAAGNVGLVGAGVFVMCEQNYGVPLWIALTLAVAAGAMFNALVELVVVRRLARAPRVIVVVATIGVAQLSLLILNAYPGVVGERLVWPQPMTSTWTLGGIMIAGPQLVVIVAVPVIALGLGLLLDRTAFGRAIRAGADEPDLARLRGINPKTWSTVVWAFAGVLSTLAITMRAGIAGTTLGLQAVGVATLLRAVIAAVIADFSSIRVALAGAVAIGVGESLVRFNFIDHPGLTELLLLVVALVAIGARRGGGTTTSSAPYAYVPRTRVLPTHMRRVWWLRNLDRLMMLTLLAGAIVVPLLVTQPSRHLLYATIAGFAICACSLTVLTGWAGQVSLGQMAFAGLGALTGAAFARGLVVDWVVAQRRVVFFELYPLPFALSIIVGGVVAAMVAVIVGTGALRVHGLALAVSTFAFAIAASGWLYRLDVLSGGNVASVPYPRGDLLGLDLTNQRNYYFSTLAVLVVVVALLGRLRRSGVGRVTLAVRDNIDAAAAYTVNPSFAKMRVFALSGLIAGVGGAVLGGARQRIPFSESFFTADFSLALVAMIVIGGMGSTAGAIIGSVWVIGLPALFPDNDLVPLLASSIGLLILLLYFPGGLVGIAHQARAQIYDAAERRLASPVPEVVARSPRSSRAFTADQPATQVALGCRDVEVRYDGVRANAGIDLDVRVGEIVGLIGTNGAGKSTLMNAIGGFVQASGRFEILGVDVTRRPPAGRARIGLGRTFQAARLFPELTVRETIQVALEARGRTSLLEVALFSPRAVRLERRQQREADELIAFLGLGRYADVAVAALSTGTRRIVELAGLVALDARVLCLDEPTAGIAQREAEAMGPLLVEIRRELGASMLVIEHDMPLIMAMSDRMYCLESGRIIAEGPPDVVRNDSRVIASYLGTDERTIARSGKSSAAAMSSSTTTNGSEG